MNRGLVLGLLFLLAAAYMRLGLFIPVNWQDEGVIVYPIWRVAEGEIPYRDFQHLYGPSVFFLNGLLMRLFGNDLSVVRYFLLGIKAATCVLVYVAALRISGRTFAAISYSIAVVTGGLMWSPLATPYASFYATLLCLVGVVGFLVAERRFLLACGLAGLCFGIAATFKQTMGAFAFLSIALYLLMEEGESWEYRVGTPPAILIRASRWFVLIFTAGVALVYLLPRNPFWNLMMMLTPVLVLTAHLALRELRREVDLEIQLRSFWGLVTLSLAFLAPLVAYVLFYVSLGLGSDLLFNMVSGIPPSVDWFTPLPTPTQDFMVWQLACLGTFASAAIWRRRSRGVRRDWHVYAFAALVVPSLVAIGTLATGGWEALYARMWLFRGFESLLFSMPFVLVGVALVAMIRIAKDDAPAESPSRRRSFLVLTCYASMSLLWLFPAGDIWHILAMLPSCLALLAWLLDRFWRLPAAEDNEDRRWQNVAGALVLGLTLTLLVPPAHDLMVQSQDEPTFAKSLPRATGLRGDSSSMTRNGGRLVRYLVGREHRDKPLFFLSSRQLFYFLTDRISPVQEFEFTLYMTAIDAVREDRAREMLDENVLIRRLQEVRPLIVDDSYDRSSARIRQMYPRLAQFVDNHYRLESNFGRFRVLEPLSTPLRP